MTMRHGDMLVVATGVRNVETLYRRISSNVNSAILGLAIGVGETGYDPRFHIDEFREWMSGPIDS